MMGYFSNGAQGLDYQEAYCVKCVNYRGEEDAEGCAIWDAHLIANYDEANNKESILHMLIPRDGLDNGQCLMFLTADDLAGVVHDG